MLYVAAGVLIATYVLAFALCRASAIGDRAARALHDEHHAHDGADLEVTR